MDNRNQIKISYIVIFVTVVSCIVYYFTSFEEKIAVCGTPNTIVINGKVLNEQLKEGRKLFKINCAACHKLEKRLIGPALGNIKMDSITFYNLLTIRDTINSKPHKPSFSQLSIQNTNDILEYLKNIATVIPQKTESQKKVKY